MEDEEAIKPEESMPDRQWLGWKSVCMVSATTNLLIVLASAYAWWAGTLASLLYLAALIYDGRKSEFNVNAAVVELWARTLKVCRDTSKKLQEVYLSTQSNQQSQDIPEDEEAITSAEEKPPSSSPASEPTSSPTSNTSSKTFSVRSAHFSASVWFALLVCALPLPGITVIYGRNSMLCSVSRGHTQEGMSMGIDMPDEALQSQQSFIWETNWTTLPEPIAKKFKNSDEFERHGNVIEPEMEENELVSPSAHVSIGNTVYLLDTIPEGKHFDHDGKSLLVFDPESKENKLVTAVPGNKDSELPNMNWIIGISDGKLCGSSNGRYVWADTHWDDSGSASQESTIFCGNKDQGFQGAKMAGLGIYRVWWDVVYYHGRLWFRVSNYRPNENMPANIWYSSAIVSLDVSSMSLTVHSKLVKKKDRRHGVSAHQETVCTSGAFFGFLFSVCPVIITSILVWFCTDVESVFVGLFIALGLSILFCAHDPDEAYGIYLVVLSPIWLLVSTLLMIVHSTPLRKKRSIWSVFASSLGSVGVYPFLFLFELDDIRAVSEAVFCFALPYGLFMAAIGIVTDLEPIFFLGLGSGAVFVVGATIAGGIESVVLVPLELAMFYVVGKLLHKNRSRLKYLPLYCLSKLIRYSRRGVEIVESKLPSATEVEGLLSSDDNNRSV